jgi:hypothetical protein
MIDAGRLKAHRRAAGLLKKGLCPDLSAARKGDQTRSPCCLRWRSTTGFAAVEGRSDE